MTRIIILMLSALPLFGWAQEKVKLTGCVKNSADSSVLVGAIVLLTAETEHKINIQSITDINGSFELFLPAYTYNLSIQYMGKEYPYRDNPIVAKGKESSLGDIFMDTPAYRIDEVVVTGTRPFVSYQTDKTLINLSANVATAKGSVADGILKIPGVNLSTRGDLSLYGIYPLVVYIDSRKSNMSVQQLSDYLSSMSVEDLEIVELITNPGPEYGKNTQSILNIKTKRRANDGVNGFVSATGEYFNLFSGRSAARLNINKGISKNYISYSYTDFRRNTSTDIEFISHNQPLAEENFKLSEKETLSPQVSQWLHLGSDLAVSEKSILGAKISLNTATNDLKTTSEINALPPSQTVIKTGYKPLYANLFYSYTNNKINWVNNLDYNGSSFTRDNSFGNNTLQSINEKNRFSRFASDFNFRFSSKFSAALGVSAEISDIKSQTTSQASVSHYSYSELNSAAYISSRYTSNGYFVSAGLRFNIEKSSGDFEKYSHKIDTSLIIFQPNITISKDFGSKHQLKISYNRSYTRPDFRDIIPYQSYTGSYIRRIGNPNLQISTENLVSFAYTYLRAAMVEISYNYTTSPIVEFISETPSELTIYKSNLDKSEFIRFLIALPIPYTKSWMGSTYFAIQRQFDSGRVNQVPYTNKFTAIYVEHRESLTLKSGWYFDAQVTYYSPLMFGIYNMKEQWWIGASVSKNINNFKIALSANDIFNTNKARGELNSSNNNMISFVKNWNYPDVRLVVTFNLGNNKLNSYKNRNEQIRATRRLNTNPDQGISTSK